MRVSSESLHFVSARLGTSFLVWLVVGIALALPAGLWLLQLNMARMSADWEGRPGLSVYFELDARQSQIDAAAEFVGSQDMVADVSIISAEQALEEFRAYSGLQDALNLLGENPLPASMTARFTGDVQPEALQALIVASEQMSGVAEVVVEKTWLERLQDLSAVVSRLGVILALLFGLGAVLVTASSVRLAIEARLDELRVLLMVGATPGQVRRPFLYFGAIYGFGGGVIAAMLIAVTLVILESPLQSLLGSYDQELNMAGLNPGFLAFILLLGIALGVLGALLAVRQRLNDLEIV